MAAAFPGTNGKIAFTSYRTGGGDVYVMDADGTGVTRLTTDGSLLEQGAAWSPDGTKIAFSTYPTTNVYVMDADGTNQHLVIANGQWPAWSPNGQRIVFQRCNFCEDIWVADQDGANPVQLTFSSDREMNPSWSPDGTKIAYSRNVGGSNGEIYVMNADGSGQTNLTNNAAADFYTNWSPDGAKIAFTSTRDGNAEIYIMNADGSGVTRLTNNTYYEQYPTFSPDGTKIVWDSQKDGNSEIYVMDADGSNPVRLTNSATSDHSADWQPLSIPPVLTITGATADGSPMPGSLAGGYVLMTGGNAAVNHQIAFTAGTSSNKPLPAGYFGLKLARSTVSAADLKAYYEARGVPEPYLAYLKGAADGTNPLVYIKGDGTTTAVALADAAQYDLASTDSPMIVPDDYPPGTYMVQGVIEDLTSNETAVTLILVVMRSTCPGSDACLAVVPPEALLLCGDSRTVTFALNGVTGLYGYQFDVAYDGALVTPSPSFVDGFFTVPTEPETHSATCAADSCTFFATKLNPSAPVSGSGPVAQIALDPLGGGGGGAFDLTVSNLLLTTLDGEVIPTDLPAETLHVTACGEAAVSGTINLQGRTKPFSAPVYHDPALVTLVGPGAPYGTYTAAIDPATGNYAFTGINVDPAGTLYEIRTAYDLYISNHKTITVAAGSNAQAATRLLGGDANLSSNQLVDILDLACIGGDFGKSSDYGCDAHGSSDINDDGKVNIQDLAIAGGNYQKLSYLPW